MRGDEPGGVPRGAAVGGIEKPGTARFGPSLTSLVGYPSGPWMLIAPEGPLPGANAASRWAPRRAWRRRDLSRRDRATGIQTASCFAFRRGRRPTFDTSSSSLATGPVSRRACSSAPRPSPCAFGCPSARRFSSFARPRLESCRYRETMDGRLVPEHRFDVVRLWQQKPETLLGQGAGPAALVGLARGCRAEHVRRAARLITASSRGSFAEQTLGVLRALCGERFTRSELAEMIPVPAPGGTRSQARHRRPARPRP